MFWTLIFFSDRMRPIFIMYYFYSLNSLSFLKTVDRNGSTKKIYATAVNCLTRFTEDTQKRQNQGLPCTIFGTRCKCSWHKTSQNAWKFLSFFIPCYHILFLDFFSSQPKSKSKKRRNQTDENWLPFRLRWCTILIA